MKYDKNNSKRIYNLMVLKGKCLKYDIEHMENCSRQFQIQPRVEYNSFFSAMSDVIDNMLFFFVNDEVSSALPNRGPLGDILACALELHHESKDEVYLDYSITDVQDLFCNRTDFIIGSYFLDFTIGSFSVFEKWMDIAYSEVRERKPSKNSKKKRLKSYISSYNKCDNDKRKNEILEQIMSNCSSYVSGSQKIDFVVSLIDENYTRDKERDTHIISMYRNKRNTIHKLGVHMHNSVAPLVVRGVEIKLEQGKPSFTEDYNSAIYLCDELVELYRAVIDNLKLSKPESLFES
ncbi:hypothetical protein ACJO14_23805 [Vibrio parahaemolyticus]|uniref:hypothetical protein n=1 Tax=Vibrio parahaemolyticus TaxID=670 RepID=UPI00387B18A8